MAGIKNINANIGPWLMIWVKTRGTPSKYTAATMAMFRKDRPKNIAHFFLNMNRLFLTMPLKSAVSGAGGGGAEGLVDAAKKRESVFCSVGGLFCAVFSI